MNKELNLCEILKGHEGETFYSIYYGPAKLIEIKDEFLIFQIKSNIVDTITTLNGKSIYTQELDIVPSKDQQDWNEWIEEQKIPKTWSELNVDKHSNTFAIELKPVHDGNYQNYHYEESIWSGASIEKSALAFLKIHQLIEVGYGGNVSEKTWYSSQKDKWIIVPCRDKDSHIFIVARTVFFADKCHIVFNTKEQAEEFLSYPENVQLLKDYFMI